MKRSAGKNATRGPEFVVGIGASAGGLNAIENFFDNMPSDSGMAFVIIQHLSPDFKSLMEDLLSRHTRMKIYKVTDGISLKPNSIYLIPPKSRLTVSGGLLYLTEKDAGNHLEMPIDIFFKSLAEDKREKAIAIVLSGTGSDGSRGIVTVRDKGGFVIVQSPETAQFDGMPRSAIDTGCYNFEAEPAAMPEILINYIKNPSKYRKFSRHPYTSGTKPEGKYSNLFILLQKRFNLDFSIYKQPTIGRRITRRIALCGLKSLEDYTDYINENPTELDLLYSDLLIGVTEFFRDKKAFDVIETKVIDEVLNNADPENGVRVWSAGCATGEEPYSLSILFHERSKALDYKGKITIFATDVNKTPLDFASNGVYDASKLKNLSKERISKHFKKEGENLYRINPAIRKMVVFAPHNLISDPPFTRLDMVCCRNLLIYLSPEMQNKVISLFHFALKLNGFLFQGSSEGLGRYAEEFKTISSQNKIFQKIRDIKLAINFSQKALDIHQTAVPAFAGPGLVLSRHTVSVEKQLLNDYDYILKRHSPPGFLLNENQHLIHCFGDLHDFLMLPEGRVETDILKLVCPDLNLPISTALIRAAKTKKSISALDQPVRGFSGKNYRLDIFVDCIADEKTRLEHYHIYFRNASAEGRDGRTRRAAAKTIDISGADAAGMMKKRIASLEYDLQLTRENLQATVEELQTSNEELQATNEELLAANEEMQSTNEELHSVNEELYTVNSEFEFKNRELKQLNQDHENLLASIDIGTVFLDRNLKIRKFNPAISQFFKLMPQDIGRPIDHIAYHVSEQKTMIDNLKKVLKTGQPLEREIGVSDDRTLLKRIMPFKTETGAVDGVVLTFTDITAAKESEKKVKALNAELERRVDERTRELAEANEKLKAEIAAKNESEKQLIKAKSDAESADRSKSVFLANVSHEIKTPINAIIGFSEMLSSTPLAGEQIEYLKYIKTSGQSLMAIISDILDFSKIEAGKMELESVEFDVGRIAAEMVNLHRLMAANKKLEISLSVDENISFNVIGDPGRLKQVLSNLLSNAVKFTEKGRIEVKITLLARPAADRALIGISVRDEGIGISEENKKKLFKRFTQLSESNSRKHEGTGLGLAISDQLVKLMGAPGIEVKSRPNEGSEFYFAIDFQTGGPSAGADTAFVSAAGAAEAAVTPAALTARKLRVLLAEDNVINAALVVKMLGKMGHEVSTVANGADAVRVCTAEKFDLIILDVQMPVMDGFEAAANIRKAGVSTPIIALTASAIKGDRERCERTGINAYITKPINRVQLESVINSHAGAAPEDRNAFEPETAAQKQAEEASRGAALDYIQLRLNLEDEELMKDAAGYLVDNFNAYFKEILTAWKHDDQAETRRLAHKMKGTAANACAVSMTALLGELETIGGDGWSARTRALLDELLEEYHRYREEAARHGLL